MLNIDKVPPRELRQLVQRMDYIQAIPTGSKEIWLKQINSYNDLDLKFFYYSTLASEYKGKGDLLMAIEALKEEVSLMIQHNRHDSSSYSRIYLYLQEAGKFDIASEIMNDCIGKFDGDYRSLRYLEDKIRLALQREKRFVEAIEHGISSYYFTLYGSYEDIGSELEQIDQLDITGSSIQKMLTPLLKKAKMSHKLKEITDLIEYHLKDFPGLDFSKFYTELSLVISN